jgi:hypothetical protein
MAKCADGYRKIRQIAAGIRTRGGSGAPELEPEPEPEAPTIAQRREAAWKRDFQKEVGIIGIHPGDIDWAYAENLKYKGLDPKTAARQYAGG